MGNMALPYINCLKNEHSNETIRTYAIDIESNIKMAFF
jgi:hypothetical protein